MMGLMFLRGVMSTDHVCVLAVIMRDITTIMGNAFFNINVSVLDFPKNVKPHSKSIKR